MGITGLLPRLQSLMTHCSISKFRGKRVAIDGYMWLHKGIYGCSEDLAIGNVNNAWIKYCLKFIDMLLSFDIYVVMVFDGSNLPQKMETENLRAFKRTKNKDKADSLAAKGQSVAARALYCASVDVTPLMAAKLIKVLKQYRPFVQCIVAPYEADAQLSCLSIEKHVDLIIAEDSDTIPFGCSEVIFKLDIQGNCQHFQLEHLFTTPIESFDLTQFNQEMLTSMCVLSGCDYLESCRGIGLVNSFKLVSKHKQVATLLRNMRLQGTIPLLPAFSQQPVQWSELLVETSAELTEITASSDFVADDSATQNKPEYFQLYDNRGTFVNPTTMLLYELLFHKALATFRHQTVYDPELKKLRPLHPFICDISNADVSTLTVKYSASNFQTITIADTTFFMDISFLGPTYPDSIAIGVADGFLDPVTKQPFNLPEHIEIFPRPGSSDSSSGGSSKSSGRPSKGPLQTNNTLTKSHKTSDHPTYTNHHTNTKVPTPHFNVSNSVSTSYYSNSAVSLSVTNPRRPPSSSTYFQPLPPTGPSVHISRFTHNRQFELMQTSSSSSNNETSTTILPAAMSLAESSYEPSRVPTTGRSENWNPQLVPNNSTTSTLHSTAASFETRTAKSAAKWQSSATSKMTSVKCLKVTEFFQKSCEDTHKASTAMAKSAPFNWDSQISQRAIIPSKNQKSTSSDSLMLSGRTLGSKASAFKPSVMTGKMKTVNPLRAPFVTQGSKKVSVSLLRQYNSTISTIECRDYDQRQYPNKQARHIADGETIVILDSDSGGEDTRGSHGSDVKFCEPIATANTIDSVLIHRLSSPSLIENKSLGMKTPASGLTDRECIIDSTCSDDPHSDSLQKSPYKHSLSPPMAVECCATSETSTCIGPTVIRDLFDRYTFEANYE